MPPVLGAPPRSADPRAETASQRRARGHRQDQSQSRLSLDHTRLHAALSLSLSLTLSLSHTHTRARARVHTHTHTGPGFTPPAPTTHVGTRCARLAWSSWFPRLSRGTLAGRGRGGGRKGRENGAKLSLIGCSVVCRPHWKERSGEPKR